MSSSECPISPSAVFELFLSAASYRSPRRRAPELTYVRRPHHLSSNFKASLPSLPAPALSSVAFFASSSWARSGFVNWYLGVLAARPVLTKSLTAAAINVAADLFSQAFLCRLQLLVVECKQLVSQLFEINRTDLIMPLVYVGLGYLTTFTKMALGQTIYGPIITGVFFSLNAALQGETVEEIFARINRDMLPALKSSIVYWPICDFVTFKFIPIRLQPLVSNLFAFVWTIYMTFMASLEKATTETIS